MSSHIIAYFIDFHLMISNIVLINLSFLYNKQNGILMLVFLMSLRHPDNANNFTQVEKLLSITLNSICGQTSKDFNVIVVCNELPNIEFEDERIFYHVVDFPAPSKNKGSAVEIEPRFKDKGTKYMAGLLYAQRFKPDYVYIVDSDDWVNVNLISQLNKRPAYPVWAVNKGFIVNYQSKEYKRVSGLSRYCGSTFIYDFSYLMNQADLKNGISESSSQDELINGTSEFFVLKLMCNHTINYRHFKDLGATPKDLPLRAACWIQGTGENVSGTTGGDSGLPIDRKFIDTFSLPEIMMSNNKTSIRLQLRDILSSFKSAYSWFMTKITGVTHF